jgi:hypothetical protein
MSDHALTKEEILELRNITLRRQLLETQVRLESEAIAKEQLDIEHRVEARLGISLRQASVDLARGTIQLPNQPQEEAQGN